MQSKATLRQAAERRRALAGPVCLDDTLAAAVAAASHVASFVGFGAEPYVTPRPGWLLPVLAEDDDLDWAPYEGLLAPGRRGLREPIGPRWGVDAVASCDLVLVPALLVSLSGVRLGKGGGSYDRALRRTSGLTVALIHDFELVPVLPNEPYDVPVAAVCTPSLGLRTLAGMM